MKGDRVMACTTKRSEHTWVRSEIIEPAQRGDPNYFEVLMSTWENIYLAPEEKELLASDIADPDMRAVVMGEEYFAQKSGPYFMEFNEAIHVARERLQASPRSRIWRGWDVGLMHRYNAVVWAQLVDGQLRIFAYTIDPGGLREMCYKVQEDTARMFPHHSFFEDWVDPQALFEKSREDSEMRSAGDIMRETGLTPRSWRGAQTWMAREDAIRWRLSRMVQGEGALIICPTARCVNPDSGRSEPMLIDAFREKFRYEWDSRTQTFKDKPEKNIWSHLIDALSYMPIGPKVEGDRRKRRPKHFGKRSARKKALHVPF
jgi:hypothetical protein